MRGIAGLFGATLVLLVLSTCGTYRAVIDDYASDAPVIQDVKPTAGVSGEQVTFEIFLCIGKTLTGEERYIWDFGGGAYPNISYEAQPTVVLRDGLRAPYSAKVTVTGGCVGDDDLSTTFEFPIAVAELEVLAVTPQSGTGNGTATFSALIGAGTVTSYQWDFGGACNPNGANVANPSVSFVDVQEPTLFNAKLIVSNQFEAKEFLFTINVLPDPTPE